MRPKPEHLGPEYAAQFADRSVARAYHTRPPYPPDLFDRLLSLLPGRDLAVLDLGCGTGDVAFGLAGRVERVDAVDPSAAMLEIAAARHPSGAGGLRWIRSSAESYRPPERYGLIVAGESLHWMDWEVVFEWLPDALADRGALALVSGRELVDLPWQAETAALVSRFSTNRKFRPYDLVGELAERQLFAEAGRWSSTPAPFAQPIEAHVESFHTRNGFSRERMTVAAAAEFDAALAAAASPHCPDGWVRGHTVATVVWGTPRRPATSPS